MRQQVTRIPLSIGKPRKSAAQELLPDFVAGPENRLVAHIAQSEESILDRGNPWLLVGPGGVGKSALMARLVAQLTQQSSLTRVLVEPAVDFARRYAEAVDADDLEHFRKRYDRLELWAIDDVQGIAGKTAAQVEMAARLDACLGEGRGVIATSRLMPLQIRGMRSALASRLLGGLTISVAPPGPAASLAILNDLIKDQKLEITPQVLQQFTQSLPPRLAARRLAGALQHYVLQTQQDDGTKAKSKAATQIERAIHAAGVPSMASITSTVAKRFKLKTSELKSATRKQSVVQARGLAMYLGRQLTGSSLQQIGEYFGGRDHTTVLHALRKTETLLGETPGFARLTEELTDQLRSG